MGSFRRLAILFALLLCLTACNTMRGLGKDVEGAGQSIQKAAEKTKEAIQK